MAARRSRRTSTSSEHHVDERWMASYMDMVTVLMCMFIVLFAMSTVDAHKFQQLKTSLATGFGEVKTQKVDTAKGVIVPPKYVGKDGEMTDASQKAALELARLEKLEQEMNAALAAQGLQNAVGYDIDERGLTVHLVGANTFFAANSTELTPVAQRVLAAIAGPLNTVGNQLAVEGHADSRPPQPPYATNWELSTGRAVSVLRALVEHGHVAGTRIGATGYGSERPAAKGTSAAALAENRRVDVVVVSDQPDDVRALIPALVAAEKQAQKGAQS
ncbi:flagellar motor protein MotB [Gryllotalpicola daejeonensis]|uniref:Flagellar motor protein MotB n=1 Tax=Gryllotalpicola daejeonensis TaxID=993087 RepID=A0ABP7ZHZ3_9MICO